MKIGLYEWIGGAALAPVLALTMPLTGSGQSIEYPPESVVDQSVPIRVRGLPPASMATLSVEFTDAQDVEWVAQATFRVGASGVVNTSLDTPVEGSYSGAVPAGLFNRALPSDGDASRRFASGTLTQIPTTIVLEVDGAVRDSLDVTRHVVHPTVTMEEIAERDFHGRLFAPRSPSGGGVVVLGGSEGGYPDGLAALLAANGYVALSLPYFGADGLPEELAEIPLETVVEAIRWLDDQPGTNGRIAVFGTSKGAEAALLASTRSTEASGVVAYAPSSVAWSCICGEAERASWTWEGRSVPSVGPGADPTYDPAGGPIRPTVHYLHRKRSSGGTGLIEIERFDGPILLVAGADDQLWPSHLMAEELMARRADGRGHPLDQLLSYENAGHLIGKAFLPSGGTRIARGRLETGGSPEGNASAQADAWPRVLAFLEAVLR